MNTYLEIIFISEYIEHYTVSYKALHGTIRWKTVMTNFPLNIHHTSALKPEFRGKKRKLSGT